MAAIDSHGMKYDDTSGTLTVKHLVVTDSFDNTDATNSNDVTQTKSANYTMVEGDSGKVTYVDTDAVVITLPATVVGYTYTFVNAGADGTVGFSVSPNASDKIMGNGFTSADDKDAVNTKATAKKGDRITLVGDGVNGWFIQNIRGTWARQA